MIGSRELRFLGIVVVIALLGLTVSSTGEPVKPPPPSTRETGAFLERSVFCPPTPTGQGSTIRAVAAPVTEEEVSVSLEPAEETVDVSTGASMTADSTGVGLTAIGYGSPLIAGAIGGFTAPAEGSGGSRCPSASSDVWYFPFGTSDLGYDQRLILYNPFPDEAVARVVFADTAGENPQPALDDVAVPRFSATEVKVNDFVGTKPFVSSRVEAVRGRFIGWRVIFHRPESGPRGVSMTLGASRASDVWYFPEGVLGTGAGETLGIINPSDEEALVNVSLVTGDEVVAPPQELTEIKVARRTAETVKLDSIPGFNDAALTHASAVVRSTNGVDVVVERKLAAETGELEGISTEVGAFTTARTWMVPPPVPSPQDDTVSILNPTPKKATIDIVLRTANGTESPKELTGIEVPAGLRRQVPLGSYGGESPTVALVSADRPIVAERSGRSGVDIGDVMGTPVDRELSLGEQ